MLRILLSVALVGGFGAVGFGQDGDEAKPEVFSGPQAGEKLAPLKVKGVYGDEAGKTWNLLENNPDDPKLIVFLHQRTRPAFGLTRTLMTYMAKRKDDKLTGGIIWLTADPTETENWLGNVKQHFPQSRRMPVVYSPDGQEGPGAYGLNRNVTMTILVADKNKVTANFALVQPSLQADFPKIAKALAEVTGDEAPKLADFAPQEMRARPKQRPNPRQQPADDPKLTGLLRQFIQKDNTDEQVKKLAGEIEAYLKDKPKAQAQLGTIVSRIEAGRKLSNYGTRTAQKQLQEWGKTYGPKKPEREQPER